MKARLLDAGDGAVTIEWGDTISRELAAHVAAVEQAVHQAMAAGLLPGVVETMPTFRSLTVIYDPLLTTRAALDPLLLPLLGGPARAAELAPRRWRLPVCYEAEFGIDLAAVAERTGLAPADVVQRHAETEFVVYMIGFMPGLPFMGDLPAALGVPRLAAPRLRVPAGSVAITGTLSCIYPWQSPGGWSIVGCCPVPLFDAAAAVPSLLAPGDRVRFEPVSAARFAELRAAPLPPSAWCST